MNKLLEILTPVNIIFISVILYLTYEDFKNYFKDNYKNYKNLIINVGILGTFTGIFWGLLTFDAQSLDSIQKSIPALLDGLRTAFITSIFGMFSVLVLTFIQKQYPDKSYSEDGTEILMSIDARLKNIGNFHNTNIEILNEFRNLNNGFNEKNAVLLESLENNFEKINNNLEKSIKSISEGASKEIVSGLKTVIERFNEEISNSFGENFQELNQAVGRLLVWQDKYGTSLQAMQEGLDTAVNSIKETDKALAGIADKNEQIVEVYQLFSDIVDKYQEQTHQMNTRIMTQIELTEIMKNGIDDIKYGLNQFVQDFSTDSTEMLKGFGETKAALDQISHGIKISLSQQSESLKNLTRNIERELPKSLGQLDSALSELSEGFKEDYKTFLDYYKSLIVNQE